MKQLILILGFFLSLLTSNVLMAQPVQGPKGSLKVADLEEVTAAIQSEDTEKLVKFFAENVELHLLEKQGNYAKGQAKFIMKEFFGRNAAGQFTISQTGIIHSNYYFATGEYISDKGTYQVNIYFKLIGKSIQIDQIKFERRRG
ncbi:MAG: DUF4783 domain-containing protein [Bacteroidia bacterium]